MTEKRFQLVLYDNTMRVKEVRDNGKVIYPNEIVDLLNKLADGNKQLESYIENMKEHIAVVEEKNKELKRQLMICQGKVEGLMK